MHKKIITLIFSLFYLPIALSASVTGKWVTIDDKTNQKRAVVNITESKNGFRGKIIEVFPKPGDTGICSKCPGKFKDKPIKGLTFLWGMKKSGKNTWDGGKIMDPKTGKIYKAKMTLEGNKLFVRGYIGFSLIGRTQVWVRG